MDSSATNFGELLKEERFRKLRRKLKQSIVTENNKLKDNKGYSISPCWPNLSSIHPDALDSSNSVTCKSSRLSLQDSKVGSEVISSSSNLRKLLLSKDSYQPMATSSVKKYDAQNIDEDRTKMPPPSIGSKKPLRNEVIQTLQKNDVNYQSVSNLISNCPTSSNSNTEIHPKELHTNRIFHEWRLLLNDKGQLIIKGTLECGNVARSKPIVRRVSISIVQSIFNHIYILNGNLVDKRKELPEYVRNKFYNGFPDDWENIFQLWKNYVAQGSKVTFRWPTRITDSDDDLVSEVTVFYKKNKQFKSEEKNYFVNKNSEENLSLGYHTKTSSDSNQFDVESKKETEKSSESFLLADNISKDLSNFSGVKNICSCKSNNYDNKVDYDANSINSSSSLNNSSSYCDIIKEDKLQIILSNLSDKNCPQHYRHKFFESLECLKNILSYSVNNSELEDKKQNFLNKSHSGHCQNCINLLSRKETQEINSENKNYNCNINNHKESHNIKESVQNSSNFKQIKSNEERNSANSQLKPLGFNDGEESSDSDNYMGLPNVSLNNLLKLKSLRSRPKDRKSRSNKKQSFQSNSVIQFRGNDKKSECHQDSSISFTEEESVSEHQNNKHLDEQKRLMMNRNIKKKNFNSNSCNKLMNVYQNHIDSSVSFTDEEFSNKTQTGLNNLVPNQQNEFNNLPSKYEKQKPIIKSCEPVYYDLNLKPDLKLKSSIKSSSQADANGKKDEVSREKSIQDLMEHPFLTNNLEECLIDDSDDDEKSQGLSDESNIKSATNQSIIGNKQRRISEPFGSENNPKILSAWAPHIVFETDFKKIPGLAFEGILLNETGHVLDRKFVTNPVFKRHSSNLIETLDGEFFSLFGDLNDKKHVIPKVLRKFCSKGCPIKIKEFCEKWIKYSDCAKLKRKQDVEAPTKDEIIPVHEADTIDNIDSSNEIMKPNEFTQKKQDKIETDSQMNKNVICKVENQLEINVINTRKRIAHELAGSSSESDGFEQKKKVKNSRVKKNCQHLNQQPSNSNNKSKRVRLNDILTESAYNSRLRKRKLPCNEGAHSNVEPSTSHLSSNQEVLWTLNQEKKSTCKDVLSEDEVSVFAK